MIKFEIKGIKSVDRRLFDAARRLGVSSDDFRTEEAERILERSQKYVPFENGDLLESGEVVQFDNHKVVVRYGASGPAAAYALAIHEEPIGPSWPKSWRRKGYIEFHNGGGHKYLERAYDEITSTSLSRLASLLRLRLGG